MLETIKSAVKNATIDDALMAGLGLTGVGLAGGGIYSMYKQYKASKQFKAELDNWKQFGARSLSKNLQKRLQKHLGINVPIVTLSGPRARDYGVEDNAFFAPPPYSERLREELKLPKLKPGQKDPGVIVAGKKTALPPILAHELGHAKSYAEGKQPSAGVNAAIGGVGGLLSLVGLRLGAEAAAENPRLGWLPLVAAGAPAAISAWLLAHRTNKEEKSASTKALEALATLKNRKKYIENDKKLLDTAYDTYKYGGRANWMPAAGAAAIGGALGLYLNKYV